MNAKFETGMLKNAGIEYDLDVPCSKLTTFRTGGPCAVLVKVRNTDQLSSAVSLCTRTQMPYKIIGAGSNLLVSDKGYDGMMIKFAGDLADVTLRETHVTAGAGIFLPVLCRRSMEMELSGLEFAAGIPGTVGGALWMNAGAWGFEIFKVVSSITVFNPVSDEILTHQGPFTTGYRTGPYAGSKLIIIAARLQLIQSHRQTIENQIKELERKRKVSQPLGKPSAGSVFKNPKNIKAWELIDECGLRGQRNGGAMISEKHANFILNMGKAVSEDIYGLIQLARESVMKKKGIELVPEIEFVGEF